ncbi:MAG: GNAT family N-acetyltransferase [Lachnospiraceae bacterium]|nr:GNAT family N-acetyltransferase [Lachnospiraceae bacterium]
MDYNFRKCKETDLDFILKLKEKCFRWYIEKIYGWDEDKQLEFTKKEMCENLSDMKIIQVEGQDVGLFTFIQEENGDCLIGMFAILPEYQNHGLGTKILKDTISEHPNKRFYLKTYQENPARFLYERVGFHKYDETDTHWLMER